MPQIPTVGHVKFIGAVEDEWQLYSDNPSDYNLGRPIGFGASSIVYQAEYHSPNKETISCALKVLDLDSLPVNSLRLLRRETQLMSLSKHPNVLRVRGTWTEGHKLFIALRLMRSGSVADVMHYSWPGGVEEEVAKCVLKQALEGLNYLHINGFIHRDVKAANLLIDDDGTVLLGDLGVAASLNDEDSFSIKTTVVSTTDVTSRPPALRNRASLGKRKSFVGTPCWMAPEVVSQKQYDSKADIWSLGITALELAQGRAPRSREPPYKVLMKTIQDDPPTLDRTGGQFKYSKAFKEMIESCLMKDPNKRPTAQELLQTPFFKGSKKKSHLVDALIHDLPPLVDRQERRRIPSSLTHLSMDSWDFSLGSNPTPTAPISLKNVFVPEDSLFEMEGVGEPVASDENEDIGKMHVVFGTSISSEHLAIDDNGRGETDDSPGLTDDAVSMTSTSPPSSSLANSIPIARPGGTPPFSSPSCSEASASPGLWRKLRGKGPKMSKTGKRHCHSIGESQKRDLPPVSEDNRRGPADVGSFRQRTTSNSGLTILSQPFKS